VPERDVELTVNGVRTCHRVPDSRLLRDFLRDDVGLTGTKVGCEDGMCGACAVLVGGEVVKSCLVLAAELEGGSVTTIEGMEGSDGELHVVQQAMVDNFGFQCGFCTPGFIMTMTALLDGGERSGATDGSAGREDEYDEHSAREALAGNICRCTGYTSIVNSFLDAQSRLRATKGATVDG
jgi:aerobic carbon-monoxide dehydrogenase small subunit